MKNLKVSNFFEKNIEKIIAGGMALFWGTIAFIAIKEGGKNVETLEQLSTVSYQTQDGDKYALNDLYFVEKDSNSYYCTGEVCDVNYQPGFSPFPNVWGSHFRIASSSPVYEYVDVETGEIICVSNDNCGANIEELDIELLNDVNDGKVKVEDVNQDYLVKKIGSK